MEIWYIGVIIITILWACFFKKEDKTQIYHQIGCWLLSKVRKNVILDVFVEKTFERKYYKLKLHVQERSFSLLNMFFIIRHHFSGVPIHYSWKTNQLTLQALISRLRVNNFISGLNFLTLVDSQFPLSPVGLGGKGNIEQPTIGNKIVETMS